MVRGKEELAYDVDENLDAKEMLHDNGEKVPFRLPHPLTFVTLSCSVGNLVLCVVDKLS